MEILSYGEDPLTLLVLAKGMSFLRHRKINDQTPLKKVVVLYRPSLGRGKGGFGEFDAIVATPSVIYLIESKWHRSKEVTSKGINLSETQLRRHEIMEHLIKEWRKREVLQDHTPEHGELWRAPDPRRILRYNLTFLLKKLKTHAPNAKIKNVLLHIVPEDQFQKFSEKPMGVPKTFDYVCFPFKPIESDSDYFEFPLD